MAARLANSWFRRNTVHRSTNIDALTSYRGALCRVRHWRGTMMSHFLLSSLIAALAAGVLVRPGIGLLIAR
jgi:hypothetical protein